MKTSSIATAWLVLASLFSSPTFAQVPSIQLTADVNRDGILDCQSDDQGEEEWSLSRGALVIANVDADGSQLTSSEDSAELVIPVLDGHDNQVNGPADEFDLTWLSLQATSTPTSLKIQVAEEDQAHVRLFQRTLTGWQPLPIDGATVDVPDETPLTLGLEALSFATPSWDGRIEVTASSGEATDTIQLRVTPCLFLSSLQPAKTIFVRAYPGRNDEFLQKLEPIVRAAGASLHVLETEGNYPAHQIWLQDLMEIGYAETPQSQQSIVMPSNRQREIDQFGPQQLVGPDWGAIQVGEYRPSYASGMGKHSWLDWFGNLEVSPPTPHAPLGRIFYGQAGEPPIQLNPDIVAFIRAQELQPPFALDVSWLMIQHVDEMVSFVPDARQALGFSVLVPDPVLAINVLEKVVEQGQQDTLMLTHSDSRSVAATLADQKLLDWNRQIAEKHIQPNVDRLIHELNLDPSQIIGLPVLFREDGSALTPNMVNGLIVNGHVIMADPDGPVLDGVDVMQQTVRDLLQGSGTQVHFIDDRLYHRWGGDVHCATNAQRHGFAPNWWSHWQEQAAQR